MAVQYPFEEEQHILGGGRSNRTAITVADLDVAEADGFLEVNITAFNGTITISDTTGLYFPRLIGFEAPLAMPGGQGMQPNGNGTGRGTFHQLLWSNNLDLPLYVFTFCRCWACGRCW